VFSIFHFDTNVSLTRYTFSGKERDSESGYSYFGARYYDSDLSIWISVDPMAGKYPSLSPYCYTANNPINVIDPDGREPVRSQAGTVAGFVNFFNNTKNKMGTLTGTNAHNAMLRLGKTEWSWSQMRPMPATTNPINSSYDKYIYTEEGGWIDMSHFMFYAGKAYQYKQDGEKYPMGKALKDGLLQEISDMIVAPHSAFSYEDLPSDKFGADFGANHFDPNGKKTLGEQVKDYMNTVLKATTPNKAPNYDTMPQNDSRNTPTRTNGSSTPVYTKENP
jgi:RHS repeat-associated protein